MTADLYPRHVVPRVLDALADSPVVLIHGPRQCGKTTLVRQIGRRENYAYFSFDDPVAMAAAERDPIGFIADMPDRAILDEVQRVPAVFLALKAEVDRRRVPGRFLLTGSANVLFVPGLADSLAGRMEIVRLHPLAQAELASAKPPTFLDRLFRGAFKVTRSVRLAAELSERIEAGGYPPALARPRARRRSVWYRDYIETLVQRDVRDLSRIRQLDALPRLLSIAASQTSRLLNVTDLAAPFQVSRPTMHDYLTLLERVFLLDTLTPWHTNQLSRAVKTPKLHIGDTGVACALLGLDGSALAGDRLLLGQLLETFVFQELRRQGSCHEQDIRFFHFRDRDGSEVDIVLERGAREVAGVEVKAAASVNPGDFRGLRKLRAAAGAKFTAGVVLYDGEMSASFGDGLHAVPIRALWEMV
jgi:uncharacterized protein